MKPSFIFHLLPALQIAASAAIEPKAGEAVPWEIANTVEPSLLHMPDSWDPDSPRKWPVYLYYHGTGGHPHLNLARQYAGDDQFVLVAMAYSIAGAIQAADSARYYEQEVANLRTVRDALAAHGADPAQVYVGGYSKGGWMASYFADKAPELIAGAVVMGAGRNPFRVEDLPRYTDKMPVYIGVGTSEVNYQLGHGGIEHWRDRGATVTFDAYLGYGHVPPSRHRAEYLHQWFAIAARRDRKAQLKPIFDRWHTNTRAAAGNKDNPVRSYLLLEKMAGAPLAAFLNTTQRKALGGDLAKLREHPQVAAELRQRGAYRRILDKEVLGGYRLRVWIDCIDDYVRIYEAAPKTTVGKRAITDAHRLLQGMRTSARPEKRDMVESFMTTNASIVGKIETAPIEALNRELQELGAFLNEER